MKAHELIQILERVPNAEVKIPYPDNGDGFWPVTGATYDNNEVELFADSDGPGEA